MEGLTEKRNLKTDLKEVRDGAIWCQEEHFRKCSMARVKRNTQEHRGQHGARGMTERQRSRGTELDNGEEGVGTSPVIMGIPAFSLRSHLKV